MIRVARQTPDGPRMKPKTRVLLLLIGLILPYMVFVLSFALRLPAQPLPKWFPYVAGCYFISTIFSFPFLKKRVLARGPAPGPNERRIHYVSAGRAARRMGYIWWVGVLFYVLSGGLTHEAWWGSVLGFSWVGFLSWASFRAANALEAKARQRTA